MKDNKKVQISASVDTDTVAKITALAVKEKRSFSEMINILLEQIAKKVKPSTTNTKK